MKTKETRVSELEKVVPLAPVVVPCVEGLAEDGSAQYLNTLTGEIADVLPEHGAVIQRVCVDLTKI